MLAWKHDCLAAMARKDISANVDKQRARGAITDLTYNRLKEDGNVFFGSYNEEKPALSLGGNFVKANDALDLHHGIKYSGTETVVVCSKSSNREKHITIASAWPKSGLYCVASA